MRFEPGPYCAWVQHANHSSQGKGGANVRGANVLHSSSMTTILTNGSDARLPTTDGQLLWINNGGPCGREEIMVTDRCLVVSVPPYRSILLSSADDMLPRDSNISTHQSKFARTRVEHFWGAFHPRGSILYRVVRKSCTFFNTPHLWNRSR